jgi:hypothetical protein
MDIKEAAAMREASGLVNQQDRIEQTSEARQRPLRSPSQDLLGMWIAPR